MQPYVPSAEPLLEDEPPSSGKKSKKKSKKKQTSSDPYVLNVDDDNDDDDDVEMIEVSEKKKSKSEKKKPKSERKPKSEKKKAKKSKRNLDSKQQGSTPEYYAEATVLSASGWESLDIEDINAVHSHQQTGLRYAITGDESQIVTVAIPPGESCQGEPGSMMYLSSAIDMKVGCGADWFGRCCGGESCCVVDFTNNAHHQHTGYAGLVTNDPLAKVVPIEMGSGSVGGSLIVQQGAYMASYGDVTITFSCDCNIMRCLCGGMGLVRQKIEGTGTAFLGATGTIVQKVLAHNETMLCDTNCILAYAESCTFDIKKTGGIVNWIGGGEGFFNSSVKGPGLVVVQSMNMCMLLEALAADKMYRR